jgi:hypothetical protein
MMMIKNNERVGMSFLWFCECGAVDLVEFFSEYKMTGWWCIIIWILN